MPLMSFREIVELLRRDPLAHLTSRRVGSISMFLAGRDIALAHLGQSDWEEVPIADRVEKHYGASIMPWRSWIDIVESFAADEWEAFERFLSLAVSWDDPAPTPPASLAPPPPLRALLGQIAARPAMYLGEKSIFRLADFLGGYIHTIATTTGSGSGSPDLTEFHRFCRELVAEHQDDTGRPWFRVLRFHSSSDEAAFDVFFQRWHERAADFVPLS
jgi:hypothetical protein